MTHYAPLLTIAAALTWGDCMPVKKEYGVHGLWTSSNPRVQRPNGALSEANEVVFRRPGMAEPRPGFDVGTAIDGGEGSVELVHSIIPYDGSTLQVVDADGAGTVKTGLTGVADPNQFVTETAESGHLDWDVERGNVRGVEARKNLYLTTTDAVRKITSSTDTSADASGLPDLYVLARADQTDSTNIADGTTVGYRVVLLRTDANGLVLRSAPSARSIASNTSGSGKSTRVGVFLYYDVAAGDVVEVYRSRAVPFGVVPSTEHFLALRYELTSSDVSAAVISINDITAEVDLGQALYTNGGREGLERANLRPPAAKDLALFQGSLFASNLTYRHSLQITSTDIINRTGSATGAGQRVYTGTRTNSSNVISGMSSVVGLEIGQILLANTSWSGSVPVRISAINGSDLTMTATWSGATDGSPATHTFWDTIRVKSASEDKYYPAHTAHQVSRHLVDANTNIKHLPSSYFSASSAGVLAEYDDASEVEGARRTYSIHTYTPGGESFEVFATHGGDDNGYEPILPLPTEANGEPSVQDVFSNGIAWSKTEQPEHWLAAGRRLVGKQKVDNLRIIPTRDALWVLQGKGGGIYRLSGFGEQTGWRLDEHDTSTYLLHPQLAVAYGNAVFAWTNNGPVKITDSGVQQLGVEIENLTRILETALDHEQDNYAFAVANPKDGEILWGLPPRDDLDAESAVAQVFCYNIDRNVWSQWFVDADAYTCGAYDPSTRLMHFGRDDTEFPRVERDPAAVNWYNADRDAAMTISVINPANNRIQFSTTYPYGVGSIVAQSTNFGYVTEVVGADTVEVDIVTGFAPGAATVAESFESKLSWLPDQDSFLVSRYGPYILHWDAVWGTRTWSFELENPINAGTVVSLDYTRTMTREATPALEPTSVRDETRALVPLSVAKGTQAYPSFVVNQADSRWRISGLTTWMEPVSRRVAR